MKIRLENVNGVNIRRQSGGLVIYWREDLDFNLLSCTENYIMGDIIEENMVVMRFKGIYGFPKAQNK